MAKRKSSEADGFILRPGITNPRLWNPDRPPKSEWERIRKIVLERDNHTGCSCGHRALKYMNIHHVEESEDNNPENLKTMCIACHAILHMGRNLSLKVVEIWQCELSQAEVVQRSREGVKSGLSLMQINKTFNLKRGPHAPDSTNYANELILTIGASARAYLPVPLTAIFVNLNRWQIE